MITKEQLNIIKKNMNRGASTIFVLGQGLDYQEHLRWFNEEKNDVKNLYSNDNKKLINSWKKLISFSPSPKYIPFISGYTKYVEETSPVKLARFYILNTSISCDIGECASNTTVINLNGLLHKGISKKNGLAVSVNNDIDIDKSIPTFIPEKLNYKPLYDEVCNLENLVFEQDFRSVFFIGTSGKCPIVESIFNRSLLRTSMRDPIFKCIINTSETYMDSESDLVIRADAQDILNFISESYSDQREYFK